MKKLIALLLAMVMLASVCTALADSEKVTVEFDQSVNISMLLPEGYTAAADVSNGVLISQVIKGDDALNMLVVVAADNEYDEASRLNDLTDDQKQEFMSSFMEDIDGDSWTIMTSGYGTEAAVLQTQDGGYDELIIASVYYGYDILIYAGYTDGRTITADDTAAAMQFFTDLQFEEKVPE